MSLGELSMNIFQPRPDVSPHLLRRYLTLCHYIGLISIPNYYSEPWKTRYHGYYSKCVFMYFNMYLVCIALSVFINAIHDFGEFCTRFFEFLCLFIVQLELIYFRANLSKFYELLTLMERMARDHGHHPVVGRTQKLQKFFLYSSLFSMYYVIIGE
uniref:Odorant receptor n=1 Tax=Cacopsylla melanoneura TaxID=428564 RepID=A0A8D9E8Q4_9HEMI